MKSNNLKLNELKFFLKTVEEAANSRNKYCPNIDEIYNEALLYHKNIKEYDFKIYFNDKFYDKTDVIVCNSYPFNIPLYCFELSEEDDKKINELKNIRYEIKIKRLEEEKILTLI